MRINDLLNEGKYWNTMPMAAAMDMLAVYHDIAPSIEQYRDEEGSDRLYKALEQVAREHHAEREFRNLIDTARGGAHDEFDTNPGHFKNWFPFVGSLLDHFHKLNRDSEEGGIEIDQGN